MFPSPLASASRLLLRKPFRLQQHRIRVFAQPAGIMSMQDGVPKMCQRMTQNHGNPGSYEEDKSKGPMLRFEDALPQLPVPTLEETMKRYLKSIHPLLSQSEFERSKKAVEDFTAPGGFGHTLQDRLIKRAEDPAIRNWLSEWWNHVAYLGFREPMIPYVSYFYSHRDDRKRRDPAKRAAAIVTGAIEFKRQVDEGVLEPEYMKKTPIAMSSYEWMFNSCRIPAKPADYAVKYSGEEHKHFLVIRKNNFFKVVHEHNGKSLNTTELESQFNKVYQLAEKSPGVGVMTTENRDRWTDMRQRLMKSSAGNKAALETIESASFVVCLDDATPVTLHERAIQYWHGDGTNRWFDKPIQFIVNDNGTSGFNGEHSMMDGTPTHRLNDDIMNWIFNEKIDLHNPEERSDIPDPHPIKFQLNGENMADIALATTHHVGIISQLELRVEAYQGYGKELMKKFKASPDAFVQLLIQLAYKKFYGKNRPTYESAATRKFQEGRTETCRTVSDESVAFCDAMSHPLSSNEECLDLFRKAVEAHVEYITAASDGKGVDRHLFGLTKCMQEGEETPDIFKDPAFHYSQQWFISSSQLSSEFYNGYGWSQVIDDGWGIAYMINSYNIQFNIVCKNLGADRMAFFLNEAAGDIRQMFEEVQKKEKEGKSKL